VKLELDFVQAAVVKHALKCLEEDMMARRDYRNDAQQVINELPLRKRLGERGHQSVEVVLSEILGQF